MALRRRVVLGAALAVAAMAALLMFLLAQDPDRYRAEIARMLSEAAGQSVELVGPLRLSWRPSPALIAQDVRVHAQGARVSMGSVRVEVEAEALLARRLRARRVQVEGLHVDLPAGAGGIAAPAVMPDLAVLAVDELEIRSVSVTRAGSSLLVLDKVVVRDADSASGARVEVFGQAGGHALRGVGRVRVAPARVQLDALEVHLPAGVVQGRLEVDLQTSRPRVSGDLHAGALVFRAGGGGGRLVPVRPLDLSVLSKIDAALKLKVGRLSLSGLMVSNLTVPVTVDAGLAEGIATGSFGGGTMRATLRAGAPDSSLALDLAVDGADAGSVLVMLGLTTAERGGNLALRANLRGAGADTTAVVASLAGDLGVDIRDVKVRAGAARLAGADVFATLMRSLTGAETDRTSVSCAVARFRVRDGVLSGDNAIGVQTRSTNVLGGGRISLPAERLDLALRPWPREGLGLSATALAGTVSITGPISDPSVGLTGEAALRTGATAGAALLTGGLSLIAQGLLERARGDAPCDAVSGSAGAPRGQAAPSGRAPSAAAPEGVKGALEGVGRTIKDLFGGSYTQPDSGGKADR